MSEEITMTYSDNPYIDAIVYYTKFLIENSVIKDTTEAHNQETLYSIKRGNVFVNHARMGRLTSVEDMDIPNEPYHYHDETWSHYIEYNPYYRKYAGLPPIPSIEEIVAENEATRTGDGGRKYHIDVRSYRDEFIAATGLPASTPFPNYIHEPMIERFMSEFERRGIIEQFIAEHAGDPNYDYLQYIGTDKNIDVAVCRTASQFDMLYVPPIPDTDYNDIRQKFCILYEKNRQYVMSCIYSEAMKMSNPYYDKFIIILLKVMTMMDMVTDVFDYLIHKDIFDSRTIRYLFESYGVDYYSEIPTQYQIRMIKNMNTLLKYKSTNRNIVDICNLFGFDNITVFKYYMFKERKGELIGDENGNIDNEASYDLKFLKVPINDNYAEYIDNPSYIVDYDTVTSSDKFWTGSYGELDENSKATLKYKLKQEILNQPFSCEPTKYLSIDSTEDVAKLAADLCYFYNMIFDNRLEKFTVQLPYLSSMKYPVGDVFAYLIALGYTYNGIADDIISSDMEKTMWIYGFNFDSDVDVLLKDYYDTHPSARYNDDLAGFDTTVRKFKKVYGTDISTYEEFEDIYVNNRNLHDVIKSRMNETDSYDVYTAYSIMYDALMTRQFSTEYFGTAETYSEYLDDKGYIDMIEQINKYKAMTNDEKKQMAMATEFENIVERLEEVFQSQSFQNIYSIIPTHSSNFLVACLTKVISFFKSYKTQIVKSDAVFKIDDDDNRYNILEDTQVDYVETPVQNMEPIEFCKMRYNCRFEETMETLEKVYIAAIDAAGNLKEEPYYGYNNPV